MIKVSFLYTVNILTVKSTYFDCFLFSNQVLAAKNFRNYKTCMLFVLGQIFAQIQRTLTFLAKVRQIRVIICPDTYNIQVL